MQEQRRLGEFDLKAEDIAHDLNMSRTQFFRQIKKDIGVTPSEYLEKARFEHGLHLLESGKASSVKAAAYGAGFRQVKYFSKLFKQRFGKLLGLPREVKFTKLHFYDTKWYDIHPLLV
ncbi:MAG: helix-turn-helix transcriptional regulator [Saprospirales bacterium]|nr:helix-turn-helix transcriptional regulator [Saprospirales bacterium]